MMINVDNTISMLRKLEPVGDPAAVQRYAEMHKHDPYIMSLALAEANRRKEALLAQHLNAQPSQKVNDQALQSMAAPMPEDVGIGQLPAGDMNFAGGGIVAFSDGGVPRYQTGGQPERLYRTADNQYFARPLTGQTGYEGMGPSEFAAAIYADLKKKIGPGLSPPDRAKAEREAQRQANMRAATQGSVYDPSQYGITSPAPLYSGARDYSNAATTLPEPNITQQAVNPSAAPLPNAGPGQRVPPAGGPEFLGGPGPNIAPSAPNLDAASMMAAALKNAEGVQHPYAKELGSIGQEKVKTKEEQASGLEAIQKQFSDIYKGRKERLDTKEAELDKLKDQGMGLALLQAGAAMMTTPGAFGAAIGKGVKVGTEQYAAGLDKLQAAKDKLTDARDRLEEIEAQRGELSARELLKARTEVKDTSIGAREDLVKANMQMYGLKRDEALKLVEQQVKVGLTQLEVGGRKEVAEIGARAHMAQAAATRAVSESSRMATLAESVRKNITAEALKKYPYDVNAQNDYALTELRRAVQANPSLAQYMGIPGGGGAPAAGTDYSSWGKLSTGK